jgi:hypothetical protein
LPFATSKIIIFIIDDYYTRVPLSYYGKDGMSEEGGLRA